LRIWKVENWWKDVILAKLPATNAELDIKEDRVEKCI
jgi:hypothetical protein